jgi:hypothetical protein
MRKNILNKFIILLGLLAIVSCKAKKQLVAQHKPDTATATAVDTVAKMPMVVTNPTTKAATTAVASPVKAADVFKINKLVAIRAKQIDFNTFSGKAQAKLNINGDSHDVTMNIHIKKNQQIWVSITAVLGIEVARALITPDSIKVMNKLESTYLKKPFSYVYGFTSKQINYKTLESLLIGNAVPDLVNNDAGLKPDNGNIILSGNLQDLIYQLTLDTNLRVSRTSMSNPAAGQSLLVDYSNFTPASNRIIPSHISINSSSKQKQIQVDLRYSKADFDQAVTFPFSVPARFTAAN